MGYRNVVPYAFDSSLFASNLVVEGLRSPNDLCVAGGASPQLSTSR